MEVQKNLKKHRVRNTILILLLAVLCIGAAELAACRHFAPEQYEQIIAPVRRGVRSAAGFCQDAWAQAAAFCSDLAGQAAQLWTELTTPPEAPPEMPDSQAISEPVPMNDTPPVAPLITELRRSGNQDILTGGIFDVVYFNQGDEAWAELPYGTDQIGTHGCGPAAMAIVITSMTNTEMDPAAMSQWAVEHGHWARRNGSYLSIVEGAAQAFGLDAYSVSERTPEALSNELYSGRILVALMGPGHFTQGGHFIVLRGATLSGEILVADPNSLERSLATWDPQLILDELSSNTSNGGPLWSIGLPPDTGNSENGED